ncbi:MAG: hypothetical protein ACP5E3_18995, partial [Bacteroidales bacterium]
DIYRSEKQSNGEWGPAVNLGPTINTPYNDDTPFITASGNKIFFSSYGHYNMGGYDVFMAKKNSQGEWAAPLNLGYPINTTDDNQFMVPLDDGQIAFYSKYDPKGGFGRYDIFRYRIYTADHPRMYAVEGMLDYQGVSVDPEEINISVIDKSTSDTIANLNPDDDANFNFDVPQGSYDVVFDSERFRKKILELEVGADTPIGGLKLAAPVALALIPAIIPVDEAEEEQILTILDDSIIYASPGEVVDIRFNASEGSNVIAEAKNKSELIKSENITGTDGLEKFSFAVKPGENLVTLSATDPEGKKSLKTIKVIVPDIAESEAEDSFVPRDETGISLPGTISGDTEADRLLDVLKAAATAGALKVFLDELNPKDENITTEDELMSHLYNSAEENDFTEADIDKLLIDAGVLTALDILIRDLAKVSSPDLQNYLLALDPEANGITTNRQLYDFLLNNSETDEFSRKDVYEAISRYKYPDADIQKIIDELIALSEGSLRTALQELDPVSEGITSLVDILNYLLDNTENYGYTEEEVYDLFYRYLISGEREATSDEGKELKERFSRGAKLTAGILLLEGLIILILIILARRRKNKKPSGTDMT